ncbi:MAG: efflux RND transporter periplasmic adaptor subunit [Pirellulales bacterium]
MARFLRWFAIVAVIGGAAYGFTLVPPGLWGRSAASNYRELPVTRGEVISVVNSTGTVQPVLSVQIGSFVSGPIATTQVDFNSRVKAGDTLAKIDPRLFKARIAQDRAALAHRTADRQRVAALLEQARNNERRALELRKTKSSYISQAEIDQVTADRKVFEAQLELAAASIDEATAALSTSETNLEYTVIKSPVDGVIIDRKIDPGQTVAAQFQTPVLFVVAPEMEKRMYVYAQVDEADIGLIRAAKDRNEPVKFTVDAYPDDLFHGEIYQIRLNPQTVQNVVTYTVVVEAPNPELKLIPGMTANLSFQIEKDDNVQRIPNAALRFYPRTEQVHEEFRPLLEGTGFDQETQAEEEANASRRSAAQKVEASRTRNRRHVWVIDGELLKAIEVSTGISDNENTELVSGELKEGDKLVIGIRPKDTP